MGVDVEARLALSQRLSELDIGLPVVWENTDTEPADGAYLEARLLRNRNVRLGLYPMHRHQGIFQVAVMTRQGQSAAAADRAAEAVQAHFPADARFGPARIAETPTIGDGYPDGAFWRVVVSCYWEILE